MFHFALTRMLKYNGLGAIPDNSPSFPKTPATPSEAWLTSQCNKIPARPWKKPPGGPAVSFIDRPIAPTQQYFGYNELATTDLARRAAPYALHMLLLMLYLIVLFFLSLKIL